MQISQLNVGDKVMFGTFNGSRIPWIVADKNHSGYPSGCVTLVTENMVAKRYFDSTESRPEDSVYQYGQPWAQSQIRTWLNGEFIGSFSSEEANAIIQTTINATQYRASNQTSVKFQDSVKVFLASNYEYGSSTSVQNSDGSVLSYFSNAQNLNANYNGSTQVQAWSRDWTFSSGAEGFTVVRYYNPRYISSVTNGVLSMGSSNAEYPEQLYVRPIVNVAGTEEVTDQAYGGYYGMAASGYADSIEFRLAQPIETDAAATAATLNVVRSIPSTFTFNAKICNNGFDPSPVWVDATEHADGDGSVALTNSSKTADKWGVDVLVTATRNGIDGNAWISAVQGTYV